jgi:hypothetical protein
MLSKNPVSQDAIEACLDESAPKRRSAIVPWIFALGGTGVMQALLPSSTYVVIDSFY